MLCFNNNVTVLYSHMCPVATPIVVPTATFIDTFTAIHPVVLTVFPSPTYSHSSLTSDDGRSQCSSSCSVATYMYLSQLYWYYTTTTTTITSGGVCGRACSTII